MYRGGKLSNGRLYVRVGDLWVSLKAAAEHERERSLYGKYTV